MPAARPIIGVTSYLEPASMGVWNVTAVVLPTSYVDPIVAAGGDIVVLPPQQVSPVTVSRMLDGIDGLCVSGGYDVDPAAYGQSPHPETDAPRPARDAWELELIAGATERNMPILGVCRGAQVLNVARGGTLHQHLPDVVGSSRYEGKDGVFASVPVKVVEGTLLAAVHPIERDVPVYHHQAIDALGEGLIVSALSDDGVIEAVEDPSLGFCVAVQWHPEQDPGAGRLYQGFIEAARAFRT